MNRAKTAYIVFMVTVVHGIIALLFLRGIPHISIKHIDGFIIYSSGIWLFLSSAFYCIMQILIIEKNKIKHCIFALVFGCISVLFKSLLDFLQAQAGSLFDRLIATTILDEISTFIFGILLMSVLFFVVGKHKWRKDWKKRIAKPITMIAVLIIVYLCMWFNNFYEF